MTFKETEYPNLFGCVLEKMAEYDNPALTEEILKEISKIHEAIPIYTGIVMMCISSLLENVKKNELKKGDKISTTTKKGKIFGEVQEISNGKIILKNSVEIKKSNSVEIPLEDIFSSIRLKKEILEKVWPALVFKENR